MQTVCGSNLRSKAMFGLISKNYQFLQKIAYDFGRTFPVSNVLKSMTSRHCSNDAKEGDILNSFGLPLNGGYSWECLTLRYMEKIVLCSFKSFEQCIYCYVYMY